MLVSRFLTLVVLLLSIGGNAFARERAIPPATLKSLAASMEGVKALAMCYDLPELWASSEGIAEGVRLLPLARRHSLIGVRCGHGAYNEAWLLFAWDGRSDTIPKLILFPRPDPEQDLEEVRQAGAVYMRDFNTASSVLYVLQKLLGDGSGGFYAEYRIDPKTFTPRLVLAISKWDADHENGYNFVRGKRPSGKGWRHTKGGARGCLIDVRKLDEPASASCSSWGPAAVQKGDR